MFWRVAVKPGKPIAFATRGTTLVFGLPGNPVSSLVGFELFVRPALLALQGATRSQPAFLPGRAAVDLPRNDVRDELVRARVRVEPEGVVLEPVTGQDSHMIARASPPTRSCSFRVGTAPCRPARRSATCRSSGGRAR